MLKIGDAQGPPLTTREGGPVVADRSPMGRERPLLAGNPVQGKPALLRAIFIFKGIVNEETRAIIGTPPFAEIVRREMQ